MALSLASAQKFRKPRKSTGGSMAKKTKGQKKVSKVMKEFGSGQLHAGSKKGPVVTSKKQAVAIALSEARRASRGKRRK